MSTVIDVRIKGVRAGTNGLLQMAAAATQAHQAIAQLNSVGGSVGGGSGGGGSRSGGSSGPLSNYVNSVNKLNQAVAQGKATFDDYYRVFQANNRLQRAQAAMQSKQGGNVGKALSSLVYSTRIGIGSDGLSAMPLVGKMVTAIGELAIEAPEAAVALGLVAVALSGLIMAAQAAKYGVSFAQAQIAGGGTGAQTAQLAGIGAVLGMDPGAMVGAAHGLNSWMANNPYAAAVGQANGFGPNYMGAFGNTNDSERLLKAIDLLTHMKNDQQAQKFAYGGPLEQMLWLRRVDPSILESAKATINESSSPEAQRNAANATALMNLAMERLKLIMIEIGIQVLPTVIVMLDKFMLALDLLKLGIMAVEQILSKTGLVQAPSNADMVNGINDVSSDMERLSGDQKLLNSHDEVARSMDRNTDAVNQNTRALDNSSHVWGGGQNAARSLPSRYFGPNGANGYSDAAQAGINLGQIPV